MDGIHDLGGMAGLGAVHVERDEPVFHADWERRVFRLSAAIGRAVPLTGGSFRHSIERMDPGGHYLTSSYYEHWLTGLTTLAVEAGLVSAAELDRRAGGRFPLSGPDRGVAPQEPASERLEPRFAVGDAVRLRSWHPLGHTRAPRYVQGRRGVIDRVDAPQSVPDIAAHGGGAVREPTYDVRFTAAELWGEGAERGNVVHVDVWESYLEAHS